MGKRILFSLTTLLAIGLLTGCGDEPATSKSSPVTASNTEAVEASTATANQTGTDSQQQNIQPVSNAQASEPAFKPDYISAADLGKHFEDNTVPFIFDVRSEHSYQKSHIRTALSMPYNQTDDDRLASVEGLGQDSLIITYCGCPRHLSGLAAKDLGERGYTNVQVLYEGYWHWVDNGYPVVDNESTALSTLQFEGKVTRVDRPVAGETIFLKHQRTGQLEATSLDEDGAFAVDFHLYDYQAEDEFAVILSALNHAPMGTISASRNGPPTGVIIEVN